MDILKTARRLYTRKPERQKRESTQLPLAPLPACLLQRVPNNPYTRTPHQGCKQVKLSAKRATVGLPLAT